LISFANIIVFVSALLESCFTVLLQRLGLYTLRLIKELDRSTNNNYMLMNLMKILPM